MATVILAGIKIAGVLLGLDPHITVVRIGIVVSHHTRARRGTKALA
jgi:hypothetical protein